MEIDRRAFFGVGAGLLAAGSAHARSPAEPMPATDAPDWPAPEHFRLWPGPAPGAQARLPVPAPTMNGPEGARELWLRGIAVPEVHVFRAPRPDGSALLAMPGGSYELLSIQNEGISVARNFNRRGTTVFVLAYRLPGEGWSNRHLVPLQDAQRAMRLVRARAARFAIDPARLGILGFSAGGHLAADLATAYDEPSYSRVDASDQLPARPAFAGLIYPVTTLRSPKAHRGSRDNLLGAAPSDALLAARSPVLHVTGDTPPCFLVHAVDDNIVPVENSLDWLAACRAAKVPVEAHLFEAGGHGFGLHLPTELPGSRWPELFALWMRKHGG
jgi:acetyl esterase/lipase